MLHEMQPDKHPAAPFAAADFHVWVTGSGYHITSLPTVKRNRRSKPERVITQISPFEDVETTWYAPLKEETLFLELAATPTTEEGILAFVSKRGYLGIPCGLFPARVKKKGAWVRLGEGERLSDCSRELQLFKRAVMLWEYRRARNAQELSKIVRYRRRGELAPCWTYDFGDRQGFQWFGKIEASLSLLGADNVVTAAGILLSEWINDRLSKYAFTRVIWDHRSDSYELKVEPSSLLGAVWIQFARAFAGEGEFRRCRVCGNWMPFAAIRANRVMCSTTCRQKEHRMKVAKAKAMHAAKTPIQQIATHFNTDSAAIRNWLKPRERIR